jgi:hypothetical protein
LQFQPAGSGQTDVQHQTSGDLRIAAGEEFLGGRESFGHMANGQQQIPDSVANGGVIVDHKNDRNVMHPPAPPREW